MELVPQQEEPVVPQLFWDGKERASVLMRQAYRDLDYRWCLCDVTHLFGVPASGLMARIRRYIDGRSLIAPEEINWESDPFFAIKYAHCENWDEFREKKKRAKDLTHLRAYFWDEDTERENLMCITHFKIKVKAKLDPEDTKISVSERVYFLSTDCYYSDEKWIV